MSCLAFMVFFLGLPSLFVFGLEIRDPTAFVLQKFRPWGGPNSVFQTQSAETLGFQEAFFAAYLNLSSLPLVGYYSAEKAHIGIVNYQIASNFLAGIGIWKKIDFMLDIPITIRQEGHFPDEANLYGSYANLSLSGSFLSDIRAGFKFGILEEKKDPFCLSIFFSSSFPTAFPVLQKTRKFNGTGFHLDLSTLLTKSFQKIALHLNVGYRLLLGSSFREQPLEHELFYNAGAVFTVYRSFQFLTEIFSSFFLPKLSLETFHCELSLGFQILFSRKRFRLKMAVNSPLSSGVGTPNIRVILGLQWNTFVPAEEEE